MEDEAEVTIPMCVLASNEVKIEEIKMESVALRIEKYIEVLEA